MTILDTIFAQKRESQGSKILKSPLSEMIGRALDAVPSRGFRSALEASSHRPALIAEVKKASPVRGVLREPFDPKSIAEAYAAVGVDCLSVLTCETFFQGSADYLRMASAATDLPIIRKDFTVSEYDVYEARAMGADAILLIVSGLGDQELSEFREIAEQLKMDVLVEVHSEEELDRAVASGATFIGVNNRDLSTFETRIETTESLAGRLPQGTHLVAESALRDQRDVDRVSVAGARSVLIGTAFMKAQDIGSKVREVMGWPS
ncbi:MAG: indole-3-glycerol phosphate synthase TrpC [Armatimonadetes bacterium]|nr:indole-3-glycerol phosphate synthase TrpC [Armatimonadota bacterium]